MYTLQCTDGDMKITHDEAMLLPPIRDVLESLGTHVGTPVVIPVARTIRETRFALSFDGYTFFKSQRANLRYWQLLDPRDAAIDETYDDIAKCGDNDGNDGNDGLPYNRSSSGFRCLYGHVDDQDMTNSRNIREQQVAATKLVMKQTDERARLEREKYMSRFS